MKHTTKQLAKAVESVDRWLEKSQEYFLANGNPNPHYADLPAGVRKAIERLSSFAYQNVRYRRGEE